MVGNVTVASFEHARCTAITKNPGNIPILSANSPPVWTERHLPKSRFGTKLQPMRVIAISTFRAFWERHPDAEQPLKAWYEEVTCATWTQPTDIKAQYRSASVLKNRRVVFNIKGNDYRLIVAIAYKLQIIYVKFVGTHKEFDAVDAETVDMA